MAKKITHADYVSVLSPLNITVLETYTVGSVKILHKCLVCNYEFRTKPYFFTGSRKSSCPACSRNRSSLKRALTPSEFESKISNPTVTLLSSYVNHNTKLHVLCLCGYDWYVTPHNLLNIHYGCPKCNNKLPLTQKQFCNKLKKNNPDMTVIGNYLSMSDNIEIQHLCGHIWSPVASNIVQGSGCPWCQSPGAYGTRTEYNGVMYNSRFEANCAMKLYDVISPDNVCEQVRYPNSRMTCDFVISSANMWIEVSTISTDTYMTKIAHKQKIVESSGYEFVFISSLHKMDELCNLLTTIRKL